MTRPSQRFLAISGALIAAAIFLAANLHLIVVAVGSESACVVSAAAAPARPAC